MITILANVQGKDYATIKIRFDWQKFNKIEELDGIIDNRVKGTVKEK